MNILATQYTLKTKSFELYTAGCYGNPHCEGCYSPETWNFNQGDKLNQDFIDKKITPKIKEFDNLIDNIMIFGGEPLDNSESDLMFLLQNLKPCGKPIWIFTHYEYDDALKRLGEAKQYVDYLKCGAYIPSLTTDDNIQFGIKLATSNQHIYKL